MVRHPRRPGDIELSEGTRLLDRYSILDRIGSGGMATIYRATDERLDRVVCVKLLRTTLVEGSGGTSGSQAVYKATYSHFLQEALALSKLSHSNTLRIYDFGYLDGADEQRDRAPFHVSEYLDGGNLESHVRVRGPLSPQEAIGILDSICGAVAEAHEHGILHRDIKPSNILFARVREELVPKLADFGIAHSGLQKREVAAGDSFSESVSTVALFSPRWAAPEQLCGSPEGPRTDVYALGLLTIFMLAGDVLFGDEDVRTTFNDRVRGDTLVNARLRNLRLGPDVTSALSAALLANPDDRIATAPEFARRIRESLRVRVSNSVRPLAADAKAAEGWEGRIAPPPPPIPRAPSAPAFDLSSSELLTDAPSERVVAAAEGSGQRTLRYVQVHEKLDLSFQDDKDNLVRFRVTMLPATPLSLNVKGLTCFVVKQKGRPTPAATISEDATLDLIAANQKMLGSVQVSFGQPAANGRLFLVDGRQLLVTYGEAQQAVVLMMSRSNDLIVMCRS